VEEAGQALLWLTGEEAAKVPFIGLRRRRSRHGEAYEEHFLLPDDRVALLTSKSMLLVIAPTFAQLHAAAQNGARPLCPCVAGRASQPYSHLPEARTPATLSRSTVTNDSKFSITFWGDTWHRFNCAGNPVADMRNVAV